MEEKMTAKEEISYLDELEAARSPEDRLKIDIESHLANSDFLLQAVLDVAYAGYQQPQGNGEERFCAIEDLVRTYREQHNQFIDSLYSGKGKAA